jgi:hypothetical protein
MGLKNKAAVAVTGALTAGAFITLAGALPAGAATYGTEQSGAGNVFGVGAHSAIVGSSPHGANIAFTRSVHGRTVVFQTGRNGCVTDAGGHLVVENCNGGAAQKFTEAGRGSSVALQNQASRDYVQDNGQGRAITTVRVRPGRHGQVSFTRAQQWKWIDVNPGRGNGGGKGNGGGGKGGGKNPPAPVKHGTWTATTQLSNHPDSGGGGNNWAFDNFARTATIKLVGKETTLTDCGATATQCYAYTGTLSDKGSFDSIKGVLAPNQATPYTGSTEKSAARGTFNGGATVTFYASSDHPNASLVARSVDNHGVTASGDDTTTDWVEQFFPAGTTFGTAGPNLTSWSWSYALPNLHPAQHWVDALNNGDGQGATDGNITG